MDYPSDPDVGLAGGKFTDGDPVGGVPASLDRAVEMNQVFDELTSIINAGGLTPDENDLTQILSALDNIFLARDGGSSMLGKLLAKQGVATPLNTNNAGYAFDADTDSGLFSAGDGLLQLVINGVPFMENNVTGSAKFRQGVRTTKGAPGGTEGTQISGFSFEDDGDTGLFAEGGTAASGSDLVLRIDSGEVARFSSADKSAGVSGYAKLPSGIIIQWGEFTQVDNAAPLAFTFTHPLAFPNAAFQGFLTVGNNVGVAGSYGSVEGLNVNNTTGFTVGAASTRKYRIFIIGY